MKADLYSKLCCMILVTFKLFDIRYYQPHMFNIIANENVKNMLRYSLLADACEV